MKNMKLKTFNAKALCSRDSLKVADLGHATYKCNGESIPQVRYSVEVRYNKIDYNF